MSFIGCGKFRETTRNLLNSSAAVSATSTSDASDASALIKIPVLHPKPEPEQEVNNEESWGE